MPKLKTKSSCKGRFKITGTGRVMFKQTGKSHFMTRRSGVQIRDKRKQKEASQGTSKTILRNFMNYFKKLRKVL